MTAGISSQLRALTLGGLIASGKWSRFEIGWRLRAVRLVVSFFGFLVCFPFGDLVIQGPSAAVWPPADDLAAVKDVVGYSGNVFSLFGGLAQRQGRQRLHLNEGSCISMPARDPGFVEQDLLSLNHEVC